MQSKTSCFNGTLYRKTLARWWPVWALIAVVLFFSLPFMMADAQMNGGFEDGVLPRELLYNMPLEAAANLPPLTCLFGLLTTAATFDFLFKKRSAGMMAALPVRREGLFGSGVLAGLTMLLVPGVVTAAIAAIFSAANGQPDLHPVLTWLWVYAAESVTFYGIGVFCAMLTGQILVLPCLYVLVNFGGLVLSAILQFMARLLLVGVPQRGVLDAFSWLEVLSPCAQLMHNVGLYYEDRYGRYMEATFVRGSTVLIYLAVGAALLIVALLLFRKRNMECAQEPVSVKWLGPVLKYIVTFFCALGLPAFLAVFFGGGWTTSAVGLVGFVVLGAVIGYLISEMILRKSVRVMKTGWKGMLITAAVAILVIGAMKLDVFGYVHRVPDASEIESADVGLWMEVSASGISDEAKLETLTELHRDLIEAQHPDVYGSTEVTITYHLKNGGTIERAYGLWGEGAQDLNDRIYALLRSADAKDDSRDPRHDITADAIRYAHISWTEPMPEQDPEDVYNGTYHDEQLTGAAALDLFENGILPDLEDGAFPFINQPGAVTYYPSFPCVDFELWWEEDGSQVLHYDITAKSTHTLAWLAEHGYEIPGIE